MQDTWVEMGVYFVGLPATVRLNKDEILVVFYAGEHMNKTDIKCVRFSV